MGIRWQRLPRPAEQVDNIGGQNALPVRLAAVRTSARVSAKFPNRVIRRHGKAFGSTA